MFTSEVIDHTGLLILTSVVACVVWLIRLEGKVIRALSKVDDVCVLLEKYSGKVTKDVDLLSDRYAHLDKQTSRQYDALARIEKDLTEIKRFITQGGLDTLKNDLVEKIMLSVKHK